MSQALAAHPADIAATPDTASPPSRRLRHIQHLGGMLLAPLLLLAGWELAGRCGGLNPAILPTPSVVWATFLDMLRSGDIFRHLGVSLARVLQGFALGAFAGAALGTALGLSPRLERALLLLTGLLRPIPIIAWVPMLILWMGIDEGSKITVIAIGSFWPVLLNTVQGIRQTDRKYLEVAHILGKSQVEVLRHVILPSALPALFTGLRIGLGIAWMSVIGAELIAAASGVGYLIMYARELSQPDVMLVGVFSIGIVGLSIDLLLRRVEALALRWHTQTHRVARPS